MSLLDINKKDTDDGRCTYDLTLNGETKASFCLFAGDGVSEISEQINRALQGLPGDLEITREGVKSLLNILIPGFGQQVTISLDSPEELRDNLAEVVTKMQNNLRKSFAVPNLGIRLRAALSHNNYLVGWDKGTFEFGEFLEGDGVFYVLYSKKGIQRSEAIQLLKSNLRIGNAGDSTYGLLVDALKKSGFNIQD